MDVIGKSGRALGQDTNARRDNTKFSQLFDALGELDQRLISAGGKLQSKVDVLLGTEPKPPQGDPEIEAVPNGVIESMTLSVRRMLIVSNSIHLSIDRIDEAGIGS